MATATEAEILGRIIQPDRPELPATVARMILSWKFPAVDRRRMHELLEKAKEGRISKAEKSEAERYERIGILVSILKSKARISLKTKRNDI